ncbi:tyrosine-type recombinase/integrase [Rhodopirellula europaea]|uniref:tyrosine-type recombinase/integrase n=1 Tax=Rhodopirellula europaea TaxID=1263866 RepID=UPI0030EC7EA5
MDSSRNETTQALVDGLNEIARQNGASSSVAKFDRVPAIVQRAGNTARFAWDEFFFGRVRSSHTRRAYGRAIKRFLEWCDARSLELSGISPAHVGKHMDELQLAASSKKQALAAIRHFFDGMVTRHVCILNPAASVRGDRLSVVEGKTPEISVKQARKLLHSIDTENVVGLRDKAIIAILIYTAARVGAVTKLRCRDLYDASDQLMLHFDDKGGKSREIPVRHDLQLLLADYCRSAGIEPGTTNDAPLFRTAIGKTKTLTGRGMTEGDCGKMVKRRMLGAGLPERLSPHSFRVATITDLLDQGIPLEDVQHLAGHADPRTTRLYDRRKRRITRNIVERISI